MKIQIGKEEAEPEKVLNLWLDYDKSGQVYLRSRDFAKSTFSNIEAVISNQGDIELVCGGNLMHQYPDGNYTEDDIKTIVGYLVEEYIASEYSTPDELTEILMPEVLKYLTENRNNENT